MTEPNRTASREAPLEEVRRLYTKLALHPDRDFPWAKGKENARMLGYDAQWLERLPDLIWESAAAVGNPFKLGEIKRGEIVVDLGCGTGVDLCIAALHVGAQGRAIGIDLTPAMVRKANDMARVAGLNNIEVYEADISATHLPDACGDVVISNGTINLTAHKLCVFEEAFRVLRPGGRLQIADMLRDLSAETADEACSGSWADCVLGTVEPEHYVRMIEAAGFTNVEIVSFTSYRTAATTIGTELRARKPASTDHVGSKGGDKS